MKTIEVKGDYKALVSDEDFENLIKYKWFPHKNNGLVYAKTFINRRLVFMHRMIYPDTLCDHEDLNGLNNQRNNLRPATHQENMRNRKNWGNKKYKGVSPSGKTRYAARICIDKIVKRLGTFPTEELAAKAYDTAAIENFGKFARLNFPISTHVNANV